MGKDIYILGISAYYHDSAASLIKNGEIIASVQEERFTRKKHDSNFPQKSIKYCLAEVGIDLSQVSSIVFYDKPFLKFERLLETYLAYAPKGLKSFILSMPVWLKEKLFLKNILKKELSNLSGIKKTELPQILFTEHHQSHAASAFFPSPFKKSAVLCIDGVGEWATTSVWLGDKNKLELQWEIDFPHSLGLLYSAFTYYTGFKVNSGEYKLMGLAPYGEPKYADLILDNLIDVKEDGTFRLDMDYFDYPVDLKMTSNKFNELFGGPPRKPETPISQKEMDIASSIQKVTEMIVLRICNTIHKELDVDYLCMAGGVALNCVSNGNILRKNIFKDIWIQPASGDAGGALGATLSAWYQYYNKERLIPDNNTEDFMQGSYLGPQFSNKEIREYLDSTNAKYKLVDNELDLFKETATFLKEGSVVGWFQGRMEFGPRALGNRSILGDPRNTKMQSVMNLKIKFRESFRPFAPAILAEHVSDFFEMEHSSPYMLLTADVCKKIRLSDNNQNKQKFGIEKLKTLRSSISSVTHVDYSARVQTVHKETNQRFYNLLQTFKELTTCPVLVNTSFNVRGEPIVCSPEDAYRCFMRTEMDYLILGDFILNKKNQPHWQDSEKWKREFKLD